MKPVFLGFTVLALTIAANVATAAQPAKIEAVTVTPAVAVASFAELDALRSQNAILTEKVKAAEMQAKLAGANTSPAKGLSSALPPFPSRSTGMPVSAVRFEGFSSPSAQVQMVSDTGNNAIAVISLPNGGRVSARVGSTIPSLGVVTSISMNEVVVAGKKQTFSLPFAAEPSNMASVNQGAFSQPPASMAMPPLPMRGSR